MVNRTRSRDLFLLSTGSSRRRFYPGGSWVNSGTSPSYYKTREYCKDTVGNHPFTENPLDLRFRNVTPLVYSGSTIVGAIEFDFTNFNPAANFCSELYGAVTGSPSAHVPGSISTVGYLQTELLARAKPDVPDVDLANFVWELREFPALLKHAGDLWALSRKIPDYFKRGVRMGRENHGTLASTPITVAFGWRPLLADLRTLLGVAENVERRLKRLNDASKPGGTTTRLTLRKGLLNSSQTLTYGTANFRVDRTTEFREWGVLKHTLRHSGRVPTWTYAEAANMAYSHNISAATLWNSFPWTWLIDYMYNVGSFIQAADNRIGWKATKALIMREYKTHYDLVPLTPFPAGTKSGSMDMTSKNRDVLTNPTPVIAFTPMIGQGQLVNLGALALAFGLGKPAARITR